MAQAKNLEAPHVPFSDSFIWKEFLNHLAYQYKNGLLLPDFENDPPNLGKEYRMYFNTTLNKPRYYDGTAWVTI